MTLNYVSSKAFVGKLFRDLRLPDADFVPDVYEWIMEALQEMGAKQFFIEKEKDLLVSNYRALMPSDLYRLLSVTKDDIKVPYQRKAIQTNEEELTYTAAKIGTPVDNEYSGTQSIPSVLVTNEYLEDSYYFVNGKYIITSFTGETITILYHAAYTEEGVPLIPDDATVKNALMFYVLSRLVLGGYKHPDPQFTFVNLNALWEQNKRKASVKVSFITQDKAKTFADNWVTLIPQNNLRDNV